MLQHDRATENNDTLSWRIRQVGPARDPHTRDSWQWSEQRQEKKVDNSRTIGQNSN